jgi:hypothetical protein
MPRVDESRVFNALLSYRLSGEMVSEGHSIHVKIEPDDTHAGDSPDFLLWVEVSLKLFGQFMRVRVPVPIEAEKGGIDGGALDDLRKFIDRRRCKVQLPMLVIAESGYDERLTERDLPADVTIVQIPVRAVP